MQIIVHVVVTAVTLLLISKLLRGFEVRNVFTALLTAAILGLVYALISPLADHIGQFIGRFLAATGLAYPLKLAVLFTATLAINAVVLKLVATIGPGFHISDFRTAMLGALLLVVFNVLIGEAVAFIGAHLGNLSGASLN